VDDYSSKEFGTFFLRPEYRHIYSAAHYAEPGPQRVNYSKFGSSYLVIRYTIHLFFLLMFGITAGAALGYPVAIDKWIPGGVAVMFIIMGNIMSRVRHNYLSA
jgi:hypothetical protein